MSDATTGEAGRDPLAAEKARVLAGAVDHVMFDGWSDKALARGAADAGLTLAEARAHFPRGGVDLALAYHYERDRELASYLKDAQLMDKRFRDQVAHAIVKRLEIVAPRREEVRRAVALFALPLYSADGARAVWHTADTIWTGLGDGSRDYNWYTKRATLSGVYSASVLYWLGDESEGFAATRDFVDRRIDNVMRFEKAKASVLNNPVAGPLLKLPMQLLDQIRAPKDTLPDDLPGTVREDA